MVFRDAVKRHSKCSTQARWIRCKNENRTANICEGTQHFTIAYVENQKHASSTRKLFHAHARTCLSFSLQLRKISNSKTVVRKRFLASSPRDRPRGSQLAISPADEGVTYKSGPIQPNFSRKEDYRRSSVLPTEKWLAFQSGGSEGRPTNSGGGSHE